MSAAKPVILWVVAYLTVSGSSGCLGPQSAQSEPETWTPPPLLLGDRFLYAGGVEGGQLEIVVSSIEAVADAYGSDQESVRIHTRDTTDGIPFVGDTWISLASRTPIRQDIHLEESADGYAVTFPPPQYGAFEAMVLEDLPLLASLSIFRGPLPLNTQIRQEVLGESVSIKAERATSKVIVRMDAPLFQVPEGHFAESNAWSFEYGGAGLPSSVTPGGLVLVDHAPGSSEVPWQPFIPASSRLDPQVVGPPHDSLYPSENSLPFPLSSALDTAQHAPQFVAFSLLHDIDGVSTAIYEGRDELGMRRWTLQFFAMEGQDPFHQVAAVHDVVVVSSQTGPPLVLQEGEILGNPGLTLDGQYLLPSGLVPLDHITAKADSLHGQNLTLAFAISANPSDWNTSLEATVEFFSASEESPQIDMYSAVHGQILRQIRLSNIPID